jgi:hypothetical protein
MAEKHIADAESLFIVANVPPDFCKIGKKIIPFDISQILTPEKADYSKSVFARGKPVLLVGSVTEQVNGNAGKGLDSGVSLAKGHTKVMDGSSSLRV